MSAPVVPLPPVRAPRPAPRIRTPGSAAQEALLGLVHVRAANGPENQRADQSMAERRFIALLLSPLPGWDYQDMPPSYLLAGTMNSYQSTSKTSRFA